MDYKALGLKVGLEIHRQLDTKKLFCNCPSKLRDNNPDIKVKRFLRAVESEIGEKDRVAEFELSKNRYCIYEAYSDSTCLVELDEEPIHKINQEALEVALQISLMLKARIIKHAQIMRKQVLDYSNTSGFQRTCLLALNGSLETSQGPITIASICLEEESARKIKEEKDYVIYRVDRLGIPLVEITTNPDIRTPEQARDVAAKLGMILKSTGKAKSGIGTIRQDLNLSIAKGARVEIKGVQDLKLIPLIIEKEVKRQLSLVENGKKVNEEVRKANPDGSTSFLRPMPGSSRMYIETDHGPLLLTKKLLDNVKIPKLLTEKASDIEALGINKHIAGEIISNNIDIKPFIKKYRNLKPTLIANVVVELPKEAKARYDVSAENGHLEYILDLLNSGKISKDAALDALVDLTKESFDINRYKSVSLSEIEKFIKDFIAKKKDISFNAVMGEVMKKFKGKVDGKKASELVKMYLK